ncbi:MAG: hypothetical protein HQL74_06060 [Magnetococcales bacterium]|nr:hypothetical protein [Magnetococcales bacterium]MBF0416072.1 hypothetical protein [Magnetococcales bacterium]MBF0419847.1 hypothetical protein [Magnetococcales bacterium]
MMRRLSFVALLVSWSFLGGCALAPDPEVYPMVSMPLTHFEAPDLKVTVYQAADAMILRLRDRFHKRSAILPASFVNEQNMDESTPLGRLLSRQMSARFTQEGFRMLEVKLRNNMLLEKGKGQFLLTDEVAKMRKTHEAFAVLAGSYSVAKNRVFCSAQLVRIRDGVVLAAEEFSMPFTPDIRRMLNVSQ